MVTGDSFSIVHITITLRSRVQKHN